MANNKQSKIRRVCMARKMCLIAVFSAALSVSGYGFLQGAESTIGVGIIVGSPTGIAAKYYLSEKTAIDGGLGWALSKGVVRMHGDFLFHNYSLLEKAVDFPLVLYFGGGIKTVFAKDIEIGARIPVGILYDFKKPPIDVFFELVPVLTLIPDTGFGFDAALGARYYFAIK